ncbi:hypothetical protein JCM9279_007615 [Rhodotorula babjevae]
MPPATDHPPPSASSSPPRSRHEFVSSDCSVRVRGRIVQHGPPGQIDGLQLELDATDGLSIRYPQLVSVRIRPEEQTLWSISSGERLLTLATPLLPPSDDDHADSDKHPSSSAIDDDDDDDDEGEGAHKAHKPTVVTLHEGFLPASEADHLESSPLYSSTFQVLIDGPTFPPPHFDPASLAPPTPAVRPHDGGLSGGMLNSPTIQRALLSPLLSPQRRAASQGSDASVPPLSIGLSRTSRASFSAPSDRPAAPTNPSSAASRGLAALIVPPSSSISASTSTSGATATATAAPTLGGTLTGALSSAAKRTAEELVALRRAHDAYVRRAKAELEILEARIDNFDGHVAGKEEGIVRGFRTRDERNKVASRTVDAGGSVSRSRERARGRTPVADVVEGGGEAARRLSASGSRERPLSRGRGSVERPSAPPAHGAGAASSSSSSSVPRATNKDEDVSSLIRAQDEREEDQRGRSRSRARRDEAGPPPSAHAQYAGAAGSASQRSRSRTKALAEANAKVLEGASASGSASASGTSARQGDSTSRERGGGGEAGEPGSGSASAAGPGESRGRGRGPRKGENIPATLEEEDEEDEQGGAADRRGRDRTRDRDRDGNTTTPRGDPRGSNGLLSPLSAGAGQPTSRGSNGARVGSGSSTGTTLTFNLAGHPLVAIPESEELSVTPSDKGDGPEQPAARSERLGERAQRERQKSAEQDEEDDQPFEMDEDVDVDAFDLGSPQPRTVPLESPSLEVGNGPAHTQQQQSVVSSSFRPGSFQRASALSASYNALLATHSPKMRASPHSPAVGLPVSPSVSATRAYGSPASRASPAPSAAAGEHASTLPPFSPPEAHRRTVTSAREDAQAALASSTLEHSRSARSGGPDPRDVRRGEQKIRDVLAMDVPSHRPLQSTRRRASVDTPNAATYQADDDGTDSAETSEEDDVVADLGGGSSAAGLAMSGLTSPNSGGPRGAQQQQQQQHQVGSLPIALGRPSSVNAALSSWRPDPERDWAQARERKTSLAQGREQPLVPPLKGASSSSSAAASAGARTIPTAGGGAAVLPVEPPSAPLEIESPATPRPTSAGGTGISGMPGTGASSGQHGQTQGASVAMSSSLAQSLRNAPASFGRRAEAEGRNGAREQPQPQEQGHVDRGALSSGTAAAEGVTVADEEGAEDDDDEDDDDDDGAFVPPHLVAERRERKDERWLSRSIGGSKR